MAAVKERNNKMQKECQMQRNRISSTLIHITLWMENNKIQENIAKVLLMGTYFNYNCAYFYIYTNISSIWKVILI